MAEKTLEMKGICKSFPGVKALDYVDLELEKGDVLALLGENGAGKSTLIKVLAGEYIADEGEIFIDGKKVDITGPRDSIALGVNVIYQELNNSDVLSIAENIYMGNLKRKNGLIDYKTIGEDTKKLLDRVGLNKYDPFTTVENLSVAEKQMVEIAKALSKNTKILVLDEPTAAITEEETETLFGLIRELSAQGTSVIYISHRLEEVFEISNKVMVMRDGCKVKTLETKDTNKSELIALMVGRTVENVYPPREYKGDGSIILDVKNMYSCDYIKDVSFNVRKGEILGLFGLMGAGRTQIVETIFGDKPLEKGEIYFEGKKTNFKSPIDAKKMGIGYLPSDRKDEGLFLIHSVAQNISANVIKKMLGKNGKRGLFNYKRESEEAVKWIQSLRIKTPSKDTAIESLSGGNQQKVVVGKWLADDPKLLLLNEPTRGIDVGAKLEIYNLLNDLTDQGISFVMISSELPEIMAMSDRIYVIHEGRLKGEVQREDFSQEKLLGIALEGEE